MVLNTNITDTESLKIPFNSHSESSVNTRFSHHNRDRFEMLVCYLYTIQQSFTKYLTVQLRKQKITTILKLHLDMMKCPTVHHWRDTLSSFHRICEQLQFLTTRSHLHYLLKHLYVCMPAEVCMRGASLCLHLCAHTSRLVDCSSGFCIGTYTHFPKLDCTWAHLSSTGRPQRF